jgi:hypothetical protein
MFLRMVRHYFRSSCQASRTRELELEKAYSAVDIAVWVPRVSFCASKCTVHQSDTSGLPPQLGQI